MNKKHLILIIVIVLVAVVACASYFLLFNQEQYMNVTMNGVSMEVPLSEANVTHQTRHFSIYNDTENDVGVFVYDSDGATLSDMAEAVTFAGIRDASHVGAVIQNENGLSYNYSDSNGVYSYVGNYSHKNVLVLAKNKDTMQHILTTMNSPVESEGNNTN